MKLPLSWVKEFVRDIPPRGVLAEKLTLAGLEVKAMDVLGEGWDNVFVGQITAVMPHPNADRLRLATVDLGAARETVVCGAPNLNIGDKIAFAKVGAELIDGHTGERARLKPAKIRGVVSSGMICSEKELGISERHEGILVLPPDAPVGAPLSDYLGDVVFNIEVTPNRADCLSVTGIAREAAVLTGRRLELPEISYDEAGQPIDKSVSVEILAPELCPRYSASLVTGIKLGESPDWIKRRLLACGMRPINNIVDITNYVMLEYGQPLHAFDYDRIRGQKIVVRRAAAGESIVTLDGTQRALSADTLVIADAERAVAVAGVMGGANTEVTENTTSILLEAASFNPASIHYTGRMLRLPSEACMRFERGIRAELTMPALRRATQLLIELAGGSAAQGVIDVYPGQRALEPILLSTADVKRVLGIELGREQITGPLSLLGFECGATAEGAILVTPPYWRSDIRLTVDLIEEVARVSGYDKIPSTLLSQAIPRQNPDPMVRLKRELRHRLIGYGLQETISYSLVSADMLTKLQQSPGASLKLANPMTPEQEYLRPTLRGSLLAALAANQRREEAGLRLFELGRVYLARAGDLPDERETLCAVINGQRTGKWWRGNGEPPDFYEAKGVVESLLQYFDVTARFEPGTDAALHESRQAAILADGKQLGLVGEVHPKVSEDFEITGPTYIFELDLPTLLPFTTAVKLYQPIPRFPPVVRDLAIVVDGGIPHRQVTDIVRSFPLVAGVSLFDLYTGEPVPRGKKSLAYRITYQSPNQTLTDDEVNHIQEQIIGRLARELGASLRG